MKSNDVVLAAPHGDTPRVMWSNAIVGTLIGLLLGMANLVVFTVFFAGWVPFVIGLLGVSLIAGAVQGSLLRKYTRPALGWLGMTLAGWVIAYARVLAHNLHFSRIQWCRFA